MTHLLIVLFSLFHYGRAQQTLVPFVIPLAVRSPYLNIWGMTGWGWTNMMTANYADGDRNADWDPSLIVPDLAVHVRVDNKTFVILGYSDSGITPANVTSMVVSPTQSTLSAKAGHMQINLTFLNPIEPGDWVKQSIPLSYMSLTATSLDGVAHSVQVYSDLSAYWLSGDRSQELLWMGIGDDSVIGHQVKRQNPTLSSRVTTYTDWGTLHHFMKMSDNITWKVDESSVSRRSFMLNGVLEDLGLQWGESWNYLTPGNLTVTVFAMSRDLGTIQATQDPVIWVVGYTTDPVIGYTDLSGTSQLRSPVYKVQYPDDRFLIVDFMNNFTNASSRARKLDQKILQEAAPISGPLGDLVSLATAQVYGSTQLASATSTSGGLNNSDVMAFMKNINGMPLERNRVNPVETLYSAFPAFMYIDPDLGGLLLEPLLRLQASPKYTNLYAAPDLGASYPNATVSNSPHGRGVEESGNMLIMTCAHARASGDRSLISRYYNLLTSWADYLSDSTLLIHDQYSAEGQSIDNQTNLAIKGIIAIKAMSQMSSFVNKTTDFDKYSNSSSRLYAQWKDLALAGDKHLLATYGKMGSWTLGYNLFADVWLNTSIIEPSVYNSQSSFIHNISLDSASGLPLPTDDLGTNDVTQLMATFGWNLFMAAMTPDHGLRTNLISAVHEQLFVYLQSLVPSTISVDTALGAMYAPLALKAPVKLTAYPTTTEIPSKSHTSAVTRGTIRGVLSGVAAFLVIVAVALVVWRRRRQSHRCTPLESSSVEEVMSQGTRVTITPFNLPGSTLTEVAPPDTTDLPEQLVHRSSSLEDSPPLLRAVVSVPVGLSSKELARLRSLANESRSPPVDRQPSNTPLTTMIDRDVPEGAAGAATSSSEVRILSEANVLWDETRLHAEISEPPPSYASGGA